MSHWAYYNEFDPYAAQWIRNLIAAGHVAPGEVDTRSIEDVRPDDLQGFTQCHFFAGVAVWSHALRKAGWPDSRPVWTGSCPCQPFSAAGKGAGFADERHLWPAFGHLIKECKPAIVLGEQVASKDGLGWLDLVQTDMESEGYSFGKAVLSAAGYGANHIRERIFFAANSERAGQQGPWKSQPRLHPAANPHEEASGLVNALREGTLPYVCSRHDGHPPSVGQMRAIGNAIDAEAARCFIESVMEAA